ncbi:hypothetical protein KEJ27_08680 [Candidatus Bathyarchaeota archaeon]|nr:hypothetical protein [Candidatus Bathyarchaeota archaeon]MBS7613653.1 hypothetical protein [Candidatus Bathyarchaeota archaeon]MBS7617449.1 hypothetical protein [Candidatus Bathyarchaeota archaeon]
MKKVSLYLDDKLWIKFKEVVLRRHGTLRKLSNEVENVLRASLVEENIEEAFKAMDLDVKVVSSPEDVKRSRPKLQGPSSELLIRKMRGMRIDEGLP